MATGGRSSHELQLEMLSRVAREVSPVQPETFQRLTGDKGPLAGEKDRGPPGGGDVAQQHGRKSLG